MNTGVLSQLDPAQQRELMFWLLLAILAAVVAFGAALTAQAWLGNRLKRQEVGLKQETLKETRENVEVTRELLEVVRETNDDTRRKVGDLNRKADEVKAAAHEVKQAVKLVADAPSGLSLPAVVVPPDKGVQP